MLSGGQLSQLPQLAAKSCTVALATLALRPLEQQSSFSDPEKHNLPSQSYILLFHVILYKKMSRDLSGKFGLLNFRHFQSRVNR